MNCHTIKNNITELRHKLLYHDLYEAIKNIDDLKVFLEIHIFAVWDFMSLLKKLQLELTCVKTPWVPSGNSEISYLINQIVLAEETDINLNGERKSHFELYYDAMIQIGASTCNIDFVLNRLQKGDNISDIIKESDIDPRVKDFIRHTFNLIDEGKPHKIASAFTFGREDLIPNMFTSLLKKMKKELKTESLEELIYYFERHIELDEDEHGPMALKMIDELCQNNSSKWHEANNCALESLEKRIHFWNAIKDSISQKKTVLI